MCKISKIVARPLRLLEAEIRQCRTNMLLVLENA